MPSTTRPRALTLSAESSGRMARVRQSGTDAELAVRKALTGAGVRYRLQVPVLSSPRRVADIAFSSAKVAVFVDGCFWHGCPLHASWPKTNPEFWRSKILANQARDADTDKRLHEEGWVVVRAWSHEAGPDVARRIVSVLRNRTPRAPTRKK